MEKTSKIVKSVFSNEWENPSGGTTYYYDIELENNDKGAVGVTQKDSDRVMVGQQVTYQINGNKIKIVSIESAPQKNYYKKGKSNQESFLGYAWSYAKDLHIAGKTMKDIEELNQMARYIYNEIGKMLKNEE